MSHIRYPVSNWWTSFSFHINRTNHLWDMTEVVFDLVKTHPNFYENLPKLQISDRTAPKSDQVITMSRAIKLLRFVVIRLAIRTLSCRRAFFSNRCHSRGKVTQYISPDPFGFCAKYLRFSSNGFDVFSCKHMNTVAHDDRYLLH